MSAGAELDLWPLYEHPSQVNVRQFIDEVLASALRDEMSASEVRALPAHTRAQLRVAVAEAHGIDGQLRQLAGSPLTGDERLFAVLYWRYQRLARELAETVSRAVESFRPVVEGIQAVMSSVREAIGAHMSRFRPMAALEAERHLRLVQPAGPGPVRTYALEALGSRGFSQATDAFSKYQVWPGAAPGSSALAKFDAGLRSQLKEFTAGLPRLRDSEEWQALFGPTERFLREWEASAHWFLLRSLSVRQARSLSERSRDEVIEALLDALEVAVSDAELVAEVQSAVHGAPGLSASQRRNLVHGLEHAHQREYVDACPPLLAGLEGAFWAIARQHGIIDARRYFTHKPTKPAHGVETLFKHLPLPDALKTLLRHQVFGTTGNPFRHGDACEEERRQVLMAFVALIGWLDSFTSTSLKSSLSQRLQVALPEAA